MVDTIRRRQRGRKPEKFTPKNNYDRNRQRYYYQLNNHLISEDEFHKLMDKNLEDYNSSKKNTSLAEF